MLYCGKNSIPFKGNTFMYSVWQDESLNRILRDVCARVHRAHMEVRVFAMFQLHGRLELSPYIFGGNWLET